MPADTCGFTTLESLDAFGSIDNLSFSLDSNVWATACVKYADGSITSSASVSSTGIREQYGSGDITSSATVSVIGSRVIDSGSADVTASSSVDAEAIRMRLANADISATADVTANGGFIANGACTFTGGGYFYAKPNAIFAGSSAINAVASIVAIGYKYGEEWTTLSTGSETWTQIG